MSRTADYKKAQKLNVELAGIKTPVSSGSIQKSRQTSTEAEAKAFIYKHESGNRTDAINPSSGACGIGQALPCSKLPCSLQDYACQDTWFTNYMVDRYGTWQRAKEYWLCIGLCTNKYGTTNKTTTWW